MNSRFTIKDHRSESRLFTRRSLFILLFTLFFALVLLFRLSYLQLIAHKRYSTLSQQNLLEVLPVEPNRGLIFDRNGVQLAKNIPVFNLAIIPNHVKNMTKTIHSLKSFIAINDSDIQIFKRGLKQHRRFEAVPLKMNLTESELASYYLKRYRYPGVIVQTQLLRTYPLANTLSHVLGYVGRINANELATVDRINYSGSNYIGKMGIEKYYENSLHGTVGAKQVEVDATGHIVRTLKTTRPISGNDLYLTIDSRLQQYAEEALGEKNGVIIALQPKTGQVLAMVTKPSFDPNVFVNGISKNDYRKLSLSPDHPLFNRAIRGQYAPASTIKPFLALVGLDTGAITPNTRIYDPGWFRLPESEHLYHDWRRSGHGWVNISSAIMESCDIFFYTLAVKLGIEPIHSILKQFGFGEQTHIDMPEELSGIIPSPEWKRKVVGSRWYTGDTVITGIGQGFTLVTPIQLAVATATLAERGQGFQPYLVLKSQDANGQLNSIPTHPLPKINLLQPESWSIVIEAMRGVIHNPIGTAIAFGRNSEYTVAGKTGTAEIYGKHGDSERSLKNVPKNLRNHHLFISFAPVEEPRIVLIVVVEHAGSADRIARHVLDFYFHECDKQDGAPNNA